MHLLQTFAVLFDDGFAEGVFITRQLHGVDEGQIRHAAGRCFADGEGDLIFGQMDRTPSAARRVRSAQPGRHEPEGWQAGGLPAGKWGYCPGAEHEPVGRGARPRPGVDASQG